jgi:anti-sigma factor RsiW
MNLDRTNERLREAAWRRQLTAAEEAELRAWLAAHPGAREDWEVELALTGLLARLPDTPVPSNFTARVLQAVERDAAAQDRRRVPRHRPFWRALVPRLAVAVVILAAGWFAWQWHAHVQRLKLAQSVAAVANVRALPGPQILEDFEAIRRLRPMPPADQELIALMQ